MDKYLLIDNGGTQIKYALAYEDGSIILSPRKLISPTEKISRRKIPIPINTTPTNFGLFFTPKILPIKAEKIGKYVEY